MNRRDIIKAGIVAVPASAIVASTAAEGAVDCTRLVWIAICRGIADGGSESRFKTVDQLSAEQRARGRSVVFTGENGMHRADVVVEEIHGSADSAHAALEKMTALCVSDFAAAEAEYGCVYAVSIVGPGQVFDPMRFCEHHDRDRGEQLGKLRASVSDLTKRLEKLEGYLAP